MQLCCVLIDAQVVRSTGNVLNNGTFRGAARGFGMTALLQVCTLILRVRDVC